MLQSEHEKKQEQHYSIEMENFDDADEMFVLAKDRLLDINNWHKIAPSVNAIFTCLDHQGHELHRNAHKGDFIRVTFVAGEDKLIYVDAIEYHDYPDDNLEEITLVVNAASNPTKDRVSAHANTEIAYFIIQRHGIKLTAFFKTETNFKLNANWEILLKEFLRTDDED